MKLRASKSASKSATSTVSVFRKRRRITIELLNKSKPVWSEVFSLFFSHVAAASNTTNFTKCVKVNADDICNRKIAKKQDRKLEMKENEQALQKSGQENMESFKM